VGGLGGGRADPGSGIRDLGFGSRGAPVGGLGGLGGGVLEDARLERDVEHVVVHAVLGLRVSGSGCRVSGFRFRVSGFGYQVSGFESRDSGSGFRHKNAALVSGTRYST